MTSPVLFPVIPPLDEPKEVTSASRAPENESNAGGASSEIILLDTGAEAASTPATEVSPLVAAGRLSLLAGHRELKTGARLLQAFYQKHMQKPLSSFGKYFDLLVIERKTVLHLKTPDGTRNPFSLQATRTQEFTLRVRQERLDNPIYVAMLIYIAMAFDAYIKAQSAQGSLSESEMSEILSDAGLSESMASLAGSSSLSGQVIHSQIMELVALIIPDEDLSVSKAVFVPFITLLAFNIMVDVTNAIRNRKLAWPQQIITMLSTATRYLWPISLFYCPS